MRRKACPASLHQLIEHSVNLSHSVRWHPWILARHARLALRAQALQALYLSVWPAHITDRATPHLQPGASDAKLFGSYAERHVEQNLHSVQVQCNTNLAGSLRFLRGHFDGSCNRVPAPRAENQLSTQARLQTIAPALDRPHVRFRAIVKLKRAKGEHGVAHRVGDAK